MRIWDGRKMSGCGDLDDEVDFHGDVEREGGYAEGGAGVFAAVCEDFQEEF